jgi:hypothetical protein
MKNGVNGNEIKNRFCFPALPAAGLFYFLLTRFLVAGKPACLLQAGGLRNL